VTDVFHLLVFTKQRPATKKYDDAKPHQGVKHRLRFCRTRVAVAVTVCYAKVSLFKQYFVTIYPESNSLEIFFIQKFMVIYHHCVTKLGAI